ncbi:acetyl-CoA synthetase-like protein [Pluteus cervinus]|uniref:Acetyl-CoA synthetase-like protein n=1 Tax=Pluteus cervinus TaxID=181527 RepID=A0ACD3A6Z8_9AGAR|nr:acetyl-CoA synthetase-like protein [Pluteus cervinus]
MDFLVQPKNRTQGLSPNSNFRLPPLDGSLTPAQIYDWHYENNPHHPVFVYADDLTGELRYRRYSDVVPAIHRAGRYVAKEVGVDLDGDPRTYPAVAILALSDTITFHTTLVGMMRAEIPVATISPRLAPNVVAHLLKETKATHILVSSEKLVRDTALEALSILRRQGSEAVHLVSMPTYQHLYGGGRTFEGLPRRTGDFGAPTIIVHSSGSTSLPKPIRWNARHDLQLGIAPWYGEHDFCNQIFACHAVELFHGLGLCMLFWVISTGLIIGALPPSEPAIVPSPERIFNGLLATEPAYTLVATKYIQEWALDPAKVDFLKTLKGLCYAGTHLNKAIGDYLVKEGVHIYTVFGSSEGGCIGMFFPNDVGEDWEYIAINPHNTATLIPREDGTHEMFILGKPHMELCVKNTKVLGFDAYATNDLFEAHPTRPGFWRILGRADDQIMLSTGETINPTTLEGILSQHPYVAGAVMFGRNRPRPGVIIEPKPEFAFDPEDSGRRADFIEDIWSKIEEMNYLAEKHAQISQKMVIVASPSKPFVYTNKGLPRRPVVLQTYLTEMDTLYR